MRHQPVLPCRGAGVWKGATATEGPLDLLRHWGRDGWGRHPLHCASRTVTPGAPAPKPRGRLPVVSSKRRRPWPSEQMCHAPRNRSTPTATPPAHRCAAGQSLHTRGRGARAGPEHSILSLSQTRTRPSLAQAQGPHPDLVRVGEQEPRPGTHDCGSAHSTLGKGFSCVCSERRGAALSWVHSGGSRSPDRGPLVVPPGRVGAGCLLSHGGSLSAGSAPWPT